MVSGSFSVVLPVYNEEGNIERTIASVAAFLPQISNDYEIVAVDDGSTDKSAEILSGLSRRFSFLKVIRHSENEGYGSALRSGFKEAGKDRILLMDSDGQFDISELSKLLPWAEECDIVAGVRKKRRDSFYRCILGAAYRAIINFCFGLSLRDVDCGFKLFKSGFIKALPLSCSSILIHAEIFLYAKNKSFRVKEIDVEHLPRVFGSQKTVRIRAIFKLVFELKGLLRRSAGFRSKT